MMLAIGMLAVATTNAPAASLLDDNTSALKTVPRSPSALSGGAGVKGKPGRMVGLPNGYRMKGWEDRCAADKAKIASPGMGVGYWAYDEDATMCLYLTPNLETQVVFPIWEELVEYAPMKGGFRSRLHTSRKNVLLLQPDGYVNADAGMVVVGKPVRQPDGSLRPNRYKIYLMSEPSDTTKETFLEVNVRVRTPEGETAKKTRKQMEMEDLEVRGKDGRRIMEYKNLREDQGGANAFNYRDAEKYGARGRRPALPFDGGPGAGSAAKMSPDYLREIFPSVRNFRLGDYEWYVADENSRRIEPVLVFHDGSRTYIHFGDDLRSDQMKLPGISQVIDGIERDVQWWPTGPEHNIMKVGTLGDFILFHDGRVVCIFFKKPLPLKQLPRETKIMPSGDNSTDPDRPVDAE